MRLLQSEVVSLRQQVPQLTAVLELLRPARRGRNPAARLTTLTDAKVELQQAKVKNGKLLQKMKLQQRNARCSAGGGADALDLAMIEEVQSQAAEATRRADEAERVGREAQQEKARLAEQLGA